MTDDKTHAATRRVWLKAGIALLFAGGFALFFIAGGSEWLSVEALKQNRDQLLAFTGQHYYAMLFGGMLVYAVSTALSVPGATVLSLAAGLLFGRWVGAAVIVVAATTGATLVFLAARYLFADAAQRRAGSMAKKLMAGFHENAFNYLLFLRLVPLFPFWLVNLAPAFTAIKTRTYVAATALGIIPGSFVFAHLGQSLGRIDSAAQLVSWEMLSAFALLGLFALLPVLVKKWRSRSSMSNQAGDR